MLKPTLIAFLFFVLAASGLPGQASDPYATMTVEAFKAKVAAALVTRSGVVKHEVVQAAFNSSRIDLVEVCYDNSDLGYFHEEFDKVLPSDFKNEIVLMRLRKPWDSDLPMWDGAFLPETALLPTVQEYLPEVAAAIRNSDSKVRGTAHAQYFAGLPARLKFADLLGKAIAAKKAGLPPPTLPPATLGTNLPAPTPTPVPSKPSEPPADSSPALKWLAVAAATLAALALGLRALRRK